MNRTTRWILTGLAAVLITGAVLAVVEREIGIHSVVVVLQTADPTAIYVVLVLGLLWLGSWGYTFHLVFAALGERRPYRQSLLLYSILMLWNIIAPFSFGGGEPIAAFFISRSTGRSYESTLLSVITTDGLNYSPAPLIAVVGLVIVATMTAIGSTLSSVAVTTTGVIAGLVTVGFLGWRNRQRIETRLVSIGRWLRGYSREIAPRALQAVVSSIEGRIILIMDSIARLRRDRRAFRLGFVAATLGWVVQATMLWFSVAAVGAQIPVWAPLVVIAVVAVTDVFPVPGGIGAVDAAIVLGLVSMTNIDPVLAVTGTLVFRIATLGLPILAGLMGFSILYAFPLHHD